MLKCEGFVLRSVCVSHSLDRSNGITMYLIVQQATSS